VEGEGEGVEKDWVRELFGKVETGKQSGSHKGIVQYKRLG